MLLKDVRYRKTGKYWEAAIYNEEWEEMEHIITVENKITTKEQCKKEVDKFIWIKNGCPCN